MIDWNEEVPYLMHCVDNYTTFDLSDWKKLRTRINYLNTVSFSIEEERLRTRFQLISETLLKIAEHRIFLENEKENKNN